MAELPLQFRELANVPDLALSIERGNRLSPLHPETPQKLLVSSLFLVCGFDLTARFLRGIKCDAD